jgi:hypothetical protein
LGRHTMPEMSEYSAVAAGPHPMAGCSGRGDRNGMGLHP